jgi:hypothetical protein
MRKLRPPLRHPRPTGLLSWSHASSPQRARVAGIIAPVQNAKLRKKWQWSLLAQATMHAMKVLGAGTTFHMLQRQTLAAVQKLAREHEAESKALHAEQIRLRIFA